MVQDIINYLSNSVIEIEQALCNCRCELEQLAEDMDNAECETLLDYEIAEFDKDRIQDIADMIAKIEDEFFQYISENLKK